MTTAWLNKEGSPVLTLYFGGWGFDERSVCHLAGSGDILMFHDYRVLPDTPPVDTTNYARVDLIAWSMGVWAAALLLPRWGIAPRRAVALNGTERPVDDHHGIPTALYALTERGMDERGLEKFIRRMLDGPRERLAFDAAHRPRRPIEEQVEELRRVREQAAAAACPGLPWDTVYISRQDHIFPTGNQQDWWQGRGSEIRYLDGGHYPFFRFPSWESIIHHGNR
jgi:biotin synthesis protein BioG